jgi:hypothetical protein
LALALLLAVALPGLAQDDKAKKRLSEAEVIKLAKSPVAGDYLLCGLIEEQGVGFRVDDAALRRLKAAGVSETVRDTLLIVWKAQQSADDGESVPRPPKESSPPKPHKPAPPAKVQLPRHFDQLDLTEEQLDKMSRVAQTYDAKIAELKQKLDAARKVRYGTTGVIIGLANAIKRVSNQRQQALEDLLTDEQRDKLRQLRAGN